MVKQFSTSLEAEKHLKFLKLVRREIITRWASIEYQTKKYSLLSTNYRKLIVQLSKSKSKLFTNEEKINLNKNLYVIFTQNIKQDEKTRLEADFVDNCNEVIKNKTENDKVIVFGNEVWLNSDYKNVDFKNNLRSITDYEITDIDFIKNTSETISFISNFFFEFKFSSLNFAVNADSTNNKSVQVFPIIEPSSLISTIFSEDETQYKEELAENVEFVLEPNENEFIKQLDTTYLSLFVSLVKAGLQSSGSRRKLLLEHEKLSKIDKQIEEVGQERNNLIRQEEFKELKNLFNDTSQTIKTTKNVANKSIETKEEEIENKENDFTQIEYKETSWK